MHAPDQAIATIAQSQQGIVTREQLLACGIGRGAIEHRVRLGRLHVRHRGVYSVGHLADPHRSREMAAALACGPGVVLSHRSAGAVWGFLPALPDADVDVTLPGRQCRPKKGIRIHRVKALLAADVGTYECLPITSPARTLLDIAADLSTHELERALDEASIGRLVTVGDIRTALARNPGRRGSAALSALVDADRGITRSAAERRFNALIRKAGLPRPEVNARLGLYEVDFLWRSERLVVEIDGFVFHSGRGKFERDRRRDAELSAAGFRVLRFTWRQLLDAPELILVRLGQMMPPSLLAEAG